MAYSPDGKIIVSGTRNSIIRLWDVINYKKMGEPLLGHSSEVFSVAFSPNGKHIVSGSDDKTIRLWDV